MSRRQTSNTIFLFSIVIFSGLGYYLSNYFSQNTNIGIGIGLVVGIIIGTFANFYFYR